MDMAGSAEFFILIIPSKTDYVQMNLSSARCFIMAEFSMSVEGL